MRLSVKFLLLGVVFLFCETAFSQSLSIQATQSSICAGTEVTLYAIGGSSAVSWQPSGSTNRYLTVSPTTTTTYTLTSGVNSASYTVNVCVSNSCRTVGSFSPLLLNTGNNGVNGIFPLGHTDANWMISQTLNGAYTSAIVSSNSSIPGNYSRTIWPNAQWVGLSSSLLSPGSGTYYFRVQFNLTAAEANSLVLNMQFMADNTVMGVSVNDVLVPNSATPGGSIYGFQSPNAASANMQGPWVEGLNTLTVEIYDEGGYVGFVAQLNPAVRMPMPTVVCEPVSVIHDTLQVCRGDSVQLQAQGAVTYAWLPTYGLSDPSIANPKASPSRNTTYIVKGIDSGGNVSYDSTVVLVYDVPRVNLGSSDTIKCSDQSIVWNASSPGATVLWQDGSSNPVYTATDVGVYYVTVSNQCGFASDTVTVHACCESINVPNLFTPNEDEHNDYFSIGCLGSGGWNLQVFNSWGGLIYTNNDYQNNWNGNNASDGVYYYYLSKSNKAEYRGWVQIMR